MSNVALPGFIPYTKGGLTTELVRKRVLTNNTTAIFKGDAVVNVTTGDVIVSAATTTSAYSVQWGGASYITSGFRIERKYLPAATTYTSTTVDPANASYVYIVDDMASQKFRASIPTTTVLDRAGENYKQVLGTGSTTSGLSGHTLDAASPAATATFPWRMLEHVIGDPLNDPDSATHVHVVCILNAGSREPSLEIGGSLGT